MPLISTKERQEWLASNVGQFVPADLKAKKALWNEEQELWIYFVVYRGMSHFNNTGFAVDSPEVATRLKADIPLVRAFLAAELGTGADSLTSRTPAHLDFSDACRTRVGLDAGMVKTRVTTARQTRLQLVAKIAVRALALHRELWVGEQIDANALREIIDRRLRTVELMVYHINTVGGGKRDWKITAAETWMDGNRTRLFEFPEVGGDDNLDVLIKRAGTKLSTSDWLFEPTTGKPTRLNWNRLPPHPETGVLNEDPPELVTITKIIDGNSITTTFGAVNIRLPSLALRSRWKLSFKDNYSLRFFAGPAGTPTLAESLDELFTVSAGGVDKKTNWWDRAWLNCDHAISALQLAALLFAWRRRVAPPNVAVAEAAFNALATINTSVLTSYGQPPIDDKYVSLGPMTQESIGNSTGLLDGRNGNAYFRTTEKDVDQLEVGDHVIFRNTRVYDMFTKGLWRLENAIVLDLSATKRDGTFDLDNVQLAGHGLSGTVATYKSQFLTVMNNLLESAVSVIRGKGTAATTCEFGSGYKAIKWAPYTGIVNAGTIGPWWFAYPLSKKLAVRGIEPVAFDVSDAVLQLPGTIGLVETFSSTKIVTAQQTGEGMSWTPLEIETGTGFTPFTQMHPDMTMYQYVLFPLTQPDIGQKDDADKKVSAWARFLRRRKNEAALSISLKALKIDSSMIPGLFGPDRKVWATYPKVRPSATL